MDTKSGLITWDENGDIVLPTFAQCVRKKGETLFYVEKGLERFWSEQNGYMPSQDLKALLYGTKVLPIVSDPTSKDGDGILDVNEKWDGIDERYSKIKPLKIDTIETLYPELSLKNTNNKNRKENAIYLTIEGNNITINTRIRCKYPKDISQDEKQKYDNSITYALTERWTGVFLPSEYDFYQGLAIHVSINYVLDKGAFIEFDFRNGEGRSKCMPSHKNFLDYSKKIIIYKEDDNTFTDEKYIATIGHEFGHALGLEDCYYDTNFLTGKVLDFANLGREGYIPMIVNMIDRENNEIWYGNGNLYGVNLGEIMSEVVGKANSNNIEMMLQAFCENETQSFIPVNNFTLSKAIKTEPMPYYNYKTNKYYYYDRKNNKLILLDMTNYDNIKECYIDWVYNNFGILNNSADWVGSEW